jgi:N-acetylglucosamine-6-phosphate deacetylase
MKCRGRDTATLERIEVEFDSVINHIDPVLDGGDESVWIAPAFNDLQVNGFAGCDYNSPEAPQEDIARSIVAMNKTGVARFFPTVITGPEEKITGALRNLAQARESMPSIEAFHVEGPHISPEDGPRGAHPRQWVRPPDFEEFQRWQEAAQGHVRLVTLAAEWAGATTYIEKLAREGVATSIGHTRATPQQIRDAASAGATLSTHLGNGADSTLPRYNYIVEQLAEDRLAASFIVDGIHLPDAFLRVALRAKGIERSVLVTDAVMPAMCAPGPYRLGEVEVELKDDGRVVLRGGTRLAGSSLRMNRAIENVMRIAGLSLTEAVAMATVNPARIGRIASRQRGLRTGERADLVRFRLENGRVEVLETFVGGKQC